MAETKLNCPLAFRSSLVYVAEDLGCSPVDLDAIVAFESGWNPIAANPRSTARGLIQFIDSTSRSLGYSSSLDLVAAHPDVDSQLRCPVRRYLRRLNKPLDSLQALCMGVFFPRFMGVDPRTQFPDKVQAVNPGIVVVQDYLDLVRRRTS